MTVADVPAWWTAHRFRWGAIGVALVAVAASASGLWNGFAYDDIVAIVDNPAVHELRPPWEYFRETYWGPARGHASLYRPLTVFGFAVQWAAGSGAPWIFHAVNVLLYAAIAVVLLALLRQLLPAGPALFGAAFCAAHPVHVEAVANVVGQAELTVGLALVGAVAIFALARRRGALTLGAGTGIVAIYVTALFFKEHAIVLPALIVVAELAGRATTFRNADDDARRMRLLVLVLGLVAALYLGLRQQLLGAITGDEPHWVLRSLSMGERARAMLALVPEVWRLLLWPARLYADYSPQHTPVRTTLTWAHVPGTILMLVYLAVAAVAWGRREPLVLLALGWLAISLAPTSNILFPTGVFLAERSLFLASVAVALLAAWGAARLVGAKASAARASVIAVGLVLVGFGVAHSAVRARVWEDNATLFSTLAAEAPTNHRGPFALAEFNMIGQRYAQADSLFRIAIDLYPEHIPARLTFVQLLQVTGRCDEAMPLLRQSMRDDPGSETALTGTVICLLDAQRFEEARGLALVGAAHGWRSPLLAELRQVAESVLVAMDTVDARNRWARAGSPFESTGSPLSVNVVRQASRALQEGRGVQGERRSASPGSVNDPPHTP